MLFFYRDMFLLMIVIYVIDYTGKPHHGRELKDHIRTKLGTAKIHDFIPPPVEHPPGILQRKEESSR